MFNKVVVKNQPASQLSKTGIRVLLVGIAMLTLGQSSGCKLGIKEASMLTYRDTVWSKRAYNLRYANCEREYSEHFQNGFCAGYTDTCNGGDGYVPALPPQEYRSPEYQSADGAKCVNSWFEGYPAGVAAAKKDKSGTYHDVLISRMINSAVSQSKTTPVLPGDVKVVSANQANGTSSENQSPEGNSRYPDPQAPLNSATSIMTPATYDVPPQAYYAPGNQPQAEASPAFPEAYSVNPESSAAVTSSGNAGSDQPLVERDDAVDNPKLPLLLPAEVAPVNWNESTR